MCNSLHHLPTWTRVDDLEPMEWDRIWCNYDSRFGQALLDHDADRMWQILMEATEAAMCDVRHVQKKTYLKTKKQLSVYRYLSGLLEAVYFQQGTLRMQRF